MRIHVAVVIIYDKFVAKVKCFFQSNYRIDATKLNLFDGHFATDYYVNGVAQITQQQDTNAEARLRSSDMLCLGGEEELDRIMSGDFTAFNRSDCVLQFHTVFRWAWESWRTAVGTKIGTIYSKAIDIMNVGARANGKLTSSDFLFLILLNFEHRKHRNSGSESESCIFLLFV